MLSSRHPPHRRRFYGHMNYLSYSLVYQPSLSRCMHGHIVTSHIPHLVYTLHRLPFSDSQSIISLALNDRAICHCVHFQTQRSFCPGCGIGASKSLRFAHGHNPPRALHGFFSHIRQRRLVIILRTYRYRTGVIRRSSLPSKGCERRSAVDHRARFPSTFTLNLDV